MKADEPRPDGFGWPQAVVCVAFLATMIALCLICRRW